jgi:CubicO group peptidase (beta-lactamase class C family)
MLHFDKTHHASGEYLEDMRIPAQLSSAIVVGCYRVFGAFVAPVVRAISLTRFSIAALTGDLRAWLCSLLENTCDLTKIYRTVIRVALIVLIFSSAAKVLAQNPAVEADAGPNALLGLWGSEQVFGPLVRGSLTIDGRESQWRASIAGFNVPVERDEKRITFVLPGGVGEFRGRLSTVSKTIDGDWIQPAGVVNNNRYATPIQLASVRASVWRAMVLPLDDRVSFYASIQPKPDGTMTAFIINPEFNMFRRRSYDVTLKDGTVTFNNPKNENDHFQGTYDTTTGSLQLAVLDSYPPLLFSRRKGDAVGFFPRTPATQEYIYTKPISSDDGWATATLSETEMEAQPIAALVEKILTADQTDNPVNIQSLLIARHGKLVFEEYFYGFNQERSHDMRSAAKTFAPVLVGIARDRGIKIDPETPVDALFPDEKPFANVDERKTHVTLKTLMTMTSGFACDDNDDASPGNEDNMQNQSAQPDWYKYTLDLPMAGEPGGKHAVYCSANLNLVGGAVSHATRSWLPEFFDAYLARPLQFRTYHMNLMLTGEAYLGGGLYLRPRDQLKLGQLYLSGGLWAGRRVVSKEWVQQSTTAYSAFNQQTDFDANHEYGYGWHINQLTVGNRVFRTYSAGGNGGQIVMVIPELDLVVGFNGGSYGEFNRWYRWGLQLVPQYVIPAALGQKTH